MSQSDRVTHVVTIWRFADSTFQYRMDAVPSMAETPVEARQRLQNLCRRTAAVVEDDFPDGYEFTDKKVRPTRIRAPRV